MAETQPQAAAREGPTSPSLSPIRQQRELSLEYKLPLLITALLVAVLGGALLVTYREVTRSSRLASVESLRRVGIEIAGLSEQSTAAYRRTARGLGSDSTVRRALEGVKVSPVLLHAALAPLRTAIDSDLTVRLWGADRRPLGSVGLSLPQESARESPPPLRADSANFGPLWVSSTGVYYWVVSPVYDRERLLGWIAQRRRVGGTPRANAQIRALTGQDITVYYHNMDGSSWVTLGGGLAPPPHTSRDDAGTTLHQRPAGIRGVPSGLLYAFDARVPGTPFVITLELPVATATASARPALERLALFCTLLLLAGIGAAWILSRQLTRPLAELTEASEAMARGEFAPAATGEWSLARGDEVGRLGRSFRHMAAQVSASRAELEDQFEEATKARWQAEEANRTKSTFLATMSHEFRTPLNAIAGYTELLELGLHGPVTAEQADVLARIRRSERTLLALIEDVLSFARIEAGRVEYRVGVVSLDQVLRDAEAVIAPLAQAKGLVYELRPASGGLRIWADAEKVGQIMVNLLANAVKFTESGGRISVIAEQRDGNAIVRITDTGRGIPADKLEVIFEPFKQAETGLTRTTGGSGLGLAISRDFARRMGGDLTVESTVGKGSTFTVRLPMATAKQATNQELADANAASAAAADAGTSSTVGSATR